jgi:phosphoglycerate dehydrogenase-like enzyme
MLNAAVLISAQNDPERRILSGLRQRFPDVDWHGGSTADEIGSQLERADIVFAFAQSVTDELLARARQLRWLQLLGSGADGLLQRRNLRPSTLVTSGHGAQAVPVAEAVLGFMLALARDLPQLTRNQDRREWRRWPARLLDRSSVLIAGVGTIAAALAPRCAALGMRVRGISGAPRTLPGFDEILPRVDLHRAAADADYLVVLSALTPATRGLIDATVFAAMKPTAFLINVARGPVVREADLLEALRGGRIAGAALDVFDDEPLPRDSPLWDARGLLVSPHVAGLNARYWDDLLPLLVGNMDAFLQGRTGSLRNLVPH